MIKQITIDDKSVITACSIGGRLYGGIDVDNIPSEVMSEPSKWCYIDGEYKANEHYIPPVEPPTFEEQQEEFNLDIDFRVACLELGI